MMDDVLFSEGGPETPAAPGRRISSGSAPWSDGRTASVAAEG
jgi:hypothetical protein